MTLGTTQNLSRALLCLAVAIIAGQQALGQQAPGQQYAAPVAQQAPRSSYAPQPRPAYPPAAAQQAPANTPPNDQYYSAPANLPAGGYQQPAQQPNQPVNIRPYGSQANGNNPQAGPGGASMQGGRPNQPIRLAQQTGEPGQSPAAGSADMTPVDMSNNAAAGAQPGTEVAAGNLPVELNEHLRAATEHPLMPALRWATSEIENIRAIQDYSCFFYKRERIDGQLGGYQAMYMKVRHEPFSVYLYFKSPSNLEGQEVIYVKGLNEGNLQAHTTGIKSVVGTVSLNPTGNMAMRGNRYPVTEAGILNLLDRLVSVGNKDVQYGECDVQFFTSAQGVKVGGRPCTCIQVTHPVPRRNFIFYQARIYIDEEMHLPVRYESYDWPPQQGAQPLLMEEYTYQNLKINNGFSDIDFDTRNPKYGFR